MTGSEDDVKTVQNDDTSEGTGSTTVTSKNKPKNRGKKRKRISSDSSTDFEDVLPENTLEMEKSLHATAIKNNIDDISMRKILKKVVTNDHVLALVKLREEEEDSSTDESKLRPKITRAKAKELMKVSPKSAPTYLELTPIKHIPVKTRPEVKALIAQELPDDEDDEEYKPRQEDVPSDDDHGLESCSDVDSQPRTPATPKTQTPSPKVLHDGPFKVPQDVSSTRKKLNMDEEEATIALRTRSKLSLSATSIEHIESTFVPPDDLPMPVGDDLWNQFLTDCLDPGHTSKHEDDDEADPEYNVAADPDAADEDEDAFSNSIMKISKKELSDLVTELFNIMPEATEDASLAEDLANSVLIEGRQPELEPVPTQFPEGKGKQPLEKGPSERIADRIEFEKKGPDEVESKREATTCQDEGAKETEIPADNDKIKETCDEGTPAKEHIVTRCVEITLEEEADNVPLSRLGCLVPQSLIKTLDLKPKTYQVQIMLDNGPCILPEQICILQQQLRQHIQLATTNFLQLYVHPEHWSLAPTYKEYLESLLVLSSKPNSVVGVCNLKPAVELVRSWEKSVAADTPQNAKMVEYIKEQAERCRRRKKNNSLYVGEFHETIMKVVANSAVFLYPYLLPSMPYRADSVLKRFTYVLAEDGLLALGLDQFWEYIENNPELYPPRKHFNPRHRWGLSVVVELIVKHMVPWLNVKSLLQHIKHVRKVNDKDNPICKFFNNREVPPVKHVILPFNPNLTLYEQPEHEVPRIWLRYLSKTSRRFRAHLMRRTNVTGQPPRGIEIDVGKANDTSTKSPLPIHFTKEIFQNRTNQHPIKPKPLLQDKFDLLIDDDSSQPTNVPEKTILITPTVENAENTIIVQKTEEVPQKAIIIPPVIQNTTLGTNTVLVPSTNQPRVAEKLFTLSPMVPNTLPGQNKVVITPFAPKTELPPQKTNSDINNRRNIRNIISVCPQKSGPSNTMTVSPLPRAIPQLPQTVIPKKVLKNAPPPPKTTTNFFKVVETSTGAFLVPLNIKSDAFNPKTASVRREDTSETALIPNDLPESSNSVETLEDFMGIQESKEHCRCCVLLRRITKMKQTVITDFFTSKRKVDKKCPCKSVKFPRISRKLRLLLRYYRSKALSVVEDLEAKLEPPEEEEDNCGSSDWNLEELAYVTTYQLKLTMRSNVARNNFIKRKVSKLLSSFNIESDDPIVLARRLDRAFETEMIDVYKEFLAFLTPEQADKMDVFKDYFTRSCVADLMKKVEEHVSEKADQVKILSKLSRLLRNNFASACNICFGLLTTMDGHPKLAEYVFSLFPHRVAARCPEQPTGTQTEAVDDTMLSQDNENASHLTVDYEADHSSSGEDENYDESDIISIGNSESEHISQIKQEQSSSNTVIDTADVTITNTELQDSESSESMMIMSDEESVKTEPPDWQRYEDKLILEMLKQHLTPTELKDKTIIEIIEEKNIIGMISENLEHKSASDVKDRIVYLLKIL